MKLWIGSLILLVLFIPGCDDTTPPSPVSTISTIMGTGLLGFTGDGDVPLRTAIYNPIDLAYDPEGRLVLIDWTNARVRRVDHDGLVRTIVGTGGEDTEAIPNGAPALETPIHHSFSMALDGRGQIFLAASHLPVVMRVDVKMLVWVAAGESTAGYAGDGGPAVNALLDSPSGVAVAEQGFPLYIADTANHCIRRVDAAGVIETIAGNGTAGYSGDGGPAKNALLNGPFRVRLDREHGDLYISDTGNHRIRRIDASGIITTVAGAGTSGYTGDEGPATLAKLNSPYDARMGPDGCLYIADTYNHCIRCVNAGGVITTVAGNGTAGYQGDGGPADRAELSHPFALTFDPGGNLIVADTYNARIRRVERL